MIEREIIFKRQMFGQWRRTQGELVTHITDAALEKESEKLLNEGWHMETEGLTHVRGVRFTKMVSSQTKLGS